MNQRRLHISRRRCHPFRPKAENLYRQVLPSYMIPNVLKASTVLMPVNSASRTLLSPCTFSIAAAMIFFIGANDHQNASTVGEDDDFRRYFNLADINWDVAVNNLAERSLILSITSACSNRDINISDFLPTANVTVQNRPCSFQFHDQDSATFDKLLTVGISCSQRVIKQSLCLICIFQNHISGFFSDHHNWRSRIAGHNPWHN